MNNNTKRFVAIVGIGLALMMPINRGFGDDNSEFFAKLSAELVAMGSVDSGLRKPSARYYEWEKRRRGTTWSSMVLSGHL
jgi:hypothetical protein